MKKTILLLTVLLWTVCSFAQELNQSAIFLKDHYPADYHNTIRTHAIEDWNDDYQMIVYTINQEANALVKLLILFETENTIIAYNAIVEWSHKGHEQGNISRWNSFTIMSTANLITLHCEWTMVLYIYEKQIEAKNSF